MDELALGRLGAPHGVRGDVRLVSFSGESEHLLELSEATLKGGGREIRIAIESAREFGDGALLKIRGYDSPETVRALSGMELWAPRDKAAPLDDDQYYYADLVGCSVYSGDSTVATVVAVCDGGGGDLLEVEKAGGGSAYVPFRKEFVGRVDIASRRIELVAPWILE
ncbi:MAG: ribosome maturation factor RimM [Spirochaetes bacterium]|nr:ribosome maturation factor RimM [Spirochaetota bacterium]MBU1079135.1 ribosome maturation factor RimM [Spirochaetota bacterium]